MLISTIPTNQFNCYICYMKIIIHTSLKDNDKLIKGMLRQDQIDSGMHMKRMVQPHKDKTIYSRKNKINFLND